MTPEPAWWEWIEGWRVLRIDPRRLTPEARWAMLRAEQEEALEVWRWLQASVG